ncbi:phosphatidylserine decarboxylase family protein [Vibrio ostreicida]|uniref:Phosphatidylserine decarboxylase family protein n=1 Tax=Vibrio ostreicida TaxID=526588 RepID=A0ABT8BUN9_9VIBR|nr:phosphatidylserine decarboxylase family protein [Vibrio ostreicida]MDN3610419.1 phosphatidylserine decarboxylase family protein [Vibrio ostreicida]
MNVLNKALLHDDYCWLSINKESAARFMDMLRERIDTKRIKNGFPLLSDSLCLHHKEREHLSPVMQEFRNLIDNNSTLRMGLTKMIDQVPGYYKDPDAQGFYLRSIDEMILLVDHIITSTAPEYNETDLVGFPINSILNWTMGVPAGGEVFRNPDLNSMFEKVLNTWAEFLNSRQSLYVFDYSNQTNKSGGWRSPSALEQLNMEQYLDAPQLDAFLNSTNPVTDAHFPYQSWNDFFTRRFKNAAQRPISQDLGIVSACDSKIYNIEHDVKLENWFWVKAQPYSLRDMLANQDLPLATGAEKIRQDKQHFDTYVQPFVGGTVYQAFLSATKYHRWHSPVSGVIKKKYVKNGTYYSAALAEGMDPASPDESQGYIAHTAARAMIFIESDDPKIGLMCLMTIGMAEVSSNIITVEEDQRVTKGDQIGFFQYGGSSHCLVFQKDVIKAFDFSVGDEVEMGQLIATVNH